MEYYFKPNIKSEPLIWQWYAWPYLIPPATAACNIVERHLKIMQSYVQNPQVHAQANKDPKMMGGPFIDLNGQYVNEIRCLIDKTKSNCEELIALNNAIKEFDKIIQVEAQGNSLEEFYNRVPEPLKGLIEIVYNINHHPSIRLIEPLIYKKYYTTKHQAVAFSEVTSDYRKFLLSTPRLYQENEVNLNIEFSDKRLDALFKMRDYPDDLEKIKSLFDLSSENNKLFSSFFSEVRQQKPEDRNYNDNGVRVRYFGHACVLIQTKTVSILFDPAISYPLSSHEIQRYTFDDLPDYIDYVIITHNHQDHLMFETLLQIRYKVGSIVFAGNNYGSLEDPSIKLILQHIGFTSLIELREMENIELEEGVITALPFMGEHADLNIQSKLSYYINLNGNKFMFAADSNNIDSTLYEHIFKVIGGIDVLFLGMECDGAPLTWLYGPLLTHPLKRTHDKSRSLSGSNFEKAWLLADKSKCKKAYVYAMGQEPWLGYIMALQYASDSVQIVESNKFIGACKDKGIEAERLFGKKEWIYN